MRIAIVGSRNSRDLTVDKIIEQIPSDCTGIISGGAQGVDTLAAAAAKRLNLPLVEYLPDYDTYGNLAPLRRNRKIVENSDMVLAFWDYKSPGTRNALLEAVKAGKKIKVIIIGKKAFCKDKLFF